MRERLIAFFDSLFENAPNTTENRELREELLQNNLDKYDDLIREGTPEETAYNLVIGGLGDMGELMREIHGKDTPSPRTSRSMWIGCLVSAVMMYILSVIPPIMFSNTRYEDTLGPALMFVMVAFATGVLLFGIFYFRRRSTVRAKAAIMPDGSVVRAESGRKMSEGKQKLLQSLSGLLWAIMLVLYFVISFSTGAWNITWLIFPISAALDGVLRAIFDLTGGGKDE